MTTATLPRLRCPKDGCTQHVTPSLEPDTVICLWHGELPTKPVPQLDAPVDHRVGGSHKGMKL